MVPFPLFENTDDRIQFANRQEAGERLAQEILCALEPERAIHSPRLVVYALPKGGLPIAVPIACRLHCPLDVIVAKKISAAENSELAIGAVTADGHVIWANPRRSAASQFEREQAFHQAETKAKAQQAEFAPFRPSVRAEGTIALIVDDGIATGMTIAAATTALRSQQPAQIWICAPVAPPELLPFLHSLADRLIILATPTPFYSVSRFYLEFQQVSMEAALECLQSIRNEN